MTISSQATSAVTTSSIESSFAEAIQRLRSKGLFDQPEDSISFRYADQSGLLFQSASASTPAVLSMTPKDSTGGRGPTEGKPRTVEQSDHWGFANSSPGHTGQRISLQEETASASDAELLHRIIFQQRADVGVVIVAHSPWGSRLARLNVEMPPVFDEQIRQLGPRISRFPHPDQSTSELHRGGNAFVHGTGVVCLGTTLDRAVFNLELLEKCAKSFVLAHLTGQPIGHIPRWVQWIAGGRLKKDERKAAEAFAKGEYPELVAGY